MSTKAAVFETLTVAGTEMRSGTDPWRYVAPVGRVLFVGIFLMAGFTHFSQQTIAYAGQQGVPWAGFLVPASGLLAAAGALSILVGYKAKLGAWLLVLFLVPVTVLLHNFWAVEDPMIVAIQQAMFFKNLSLLGGALLIVHHGAGPVSLDERQERRPRS